MSNPEYLNPPRHINSLRVLVHPMYLTFDPLHIPDYIGYQRQMAEETLERFVPHAPGEVLLVMPNASGFNELKEDIKDQRTAKAKNPSWQIWPDLYRNLRAATEFPGNVNLIDNIGREIDPDGTTLTDRLAGLGFFIDTDTEIVLGGQWLDVCVETAAKKILKLPQVKGVRIDRKITPASSWLSYQWHDYIPVSHGEPFKWSSDEDYYYIDKA